MEEVNEANDYNLKQEADKKMRQEIEAETAAWLNNNPKVKEYLSQFKAGDAESFIKRYPAIKAEFMYYGSTLGDLPQQMQLGYLEIAADRLMDIQRKKLFDVMCKWDAGLVKFDDIEISDDFLKWNHNMENCPYLTPISQKEFELYMQFAGTGEFDKDAEITVNDYSYYRDYEETYGEIPAWFKFEDFYTENGKYKKLPQLRTTKEDFYTSLWCKERDEELKRKYETGELKKHVPDERPEMSPWHYSHIEQFIMANESDKEVLQLFRKHYAYFPNQLMRDNEEDEQDGWLTEQVESIIHQLSGIKEKIAVEANEDWRVALIEGFAEYEKTKVLQALPYAYSDYMMRNQIGITLSNKGNDELRFDNHLIQLAREQVLRGRELNGEPRDFNF